MHGGEGYAADGMVYRPPGKPPFPALVLIPDERGLTRRVTDTALHFVDQGYFVVAVDLNRGLSADTADRSDEQATHDLQSTLGYIDDQADISRKGVGVIGWGTGGQQAVRLAADARVRVIAIADLAPPLDLPARAKPPVDILASFAGRDPRVTPGAVQAFAAHARAQGSVVASKTYGSAGAGFDDPDSTAHYRPTDAADVLQREQDFFANALHR